MSGTEIIFEVSEDELDGGYSASALGFGIHTQGDTLDELRRNVKEAVDCYFDDAMERPAPHPAALRARRGARGLRLPRDVSGASLVAALRRLTEPLRFAAPERHGVRIQQRERNVILADGEERPAQAPHPHPLRPSGAERVRRSPGTRARSRRRAVARFWRAERARVAAPPRPPRPRAPGARGTARPTRTSAARTPRVQAPEAQRRAARVRTHRRGAVLAIPVEHQGVALRRGLRGRLRHESQLARKEPGPRRLHRALEGELALDPLVLGADERLGEAPPLRFRARMGAEHEQRIGPGGPPPTAPAMP